MHELFLIILQQHSAVQILEHITFRRQRKSLVGKIEVRVSDFLIYGGFYRCQFFVFWVNFAFNQIYNKHTKEKK